MKAIIIRTEMVGGGTSYDVLIPANQKKYRPIACGQYATVVVRGGVEYYTLDDFLRTPDLDNLPVLIDYRLKAFRRIYRLAKRLEAKIAARVFPELCGRRELPLLWADWTLPSAEKWVEFTLREKYFV